MSTKVDCFFADLEWEGIQPSLKMTRLSHGGRLVTGSATAMVKRDESYRLQCEVQGFSDHPFAASMEVQKFTAGAFAFSGECEGRLTTLSNCYIEGMDNKVDCDSGAHKNNTFTLRIHTELAEQKANGAWSEITHTDWFLNGPHGHIFTERSERDRSQTYSRKIKNLAGYVFQVGQGPEGGFSADCIVVSLSDFCFVVRKVPKEFGPTWSQKLAIDYCRKVSPIPPEETREAIAELVSFIFGRRLIDVGDTTFGEEDVPYLLRSWNPRGINIRTLCSKMDFPPCPVDLHQNKKILDIAELLKTLTPRYLSRSYVVEKRPPNGD